MSSFCEACKSSGREHLEGDSQITSRHMRNSTFGSQGLDKLQTEAKVRQGEM